MYKALYNVGDKVRVLNTVPEYSFACEYIGHKGEIIRTNVYSFPFIYVVQFSNGDEVAFREEELERVNNL